MVCRRCVYSAAACGSAPAADSSRPRCLIGCSAVSWNGICVAGSTPTNGCCVPTSMPWHLLIPSLAPLAAQNGCTAFLTSTATPCLLAACRVVSSACCMLQGAAEPSGMLMLSTSPAACSALHLAASGCAASTYSSGLSGLPCAQPDGMSNTLLRWPPLNTMRPCVPASSSCTHLRMPGGNCIAAMHFISQSLSSLS